MRYAPDMHVTRSLLLDMLLHWLQWSW